METKLRNNWVKLMLVKKKKRKRNSISAYLKRITYTKVVHIISEIYVLKPFFSTI